MGDRSFISMVVLIITLFISASFCIDIAYAGANDVHFKSDYIVAQKGDGAVSVDVFYNPETPGSLTLNYHTSDGSATAGWDYESASGSLYWAAGEPGIRSIPIIIKSNGDDTTVRDFQVYLDSTDPPSLTGVPDICTVHIVNYDNPQSITSDPVHIHDIYNVLSNEASITIPIERGYDETLRSDAPNYGGESVVVVSITGGTAIPNFDFVPVRKNFFWGHGAGGPQDFVIPILPDTVPDEGDKTIIVEMIYSYGNSGVQLVHIMPSSSGGMMATAEAPRAGSYTSTVYLRESIHATATPLPTAAITATPLPTVAVTATPLPAVSTVPSPRSTVSANPGTIGFTYPSRDVSEKDEYATVYMERTGGADGNVRVRVSSENITAMAGQDYYRYDQEFDFSSGMEGPASRKTIQVPIKSDTMSEGDESFYLTLSVISGTMTPGQSRCDITILDSSTNPTAVPDTASATASAVSPDEKKNSGMCCFPFLILPLITVFVIAARAGKNKK